MSKLASSILTVAIVFIVCVAFFYYYVVYVFLADRFEMLNYSPHKVLEVQVTVDTKIVEIGTIPSFAKDVLHIRPEADGDFLVTGRYDGTLFNCNLGYTSPNMSSDFRVVILGDDVKAMSVPGVAIHTCTLEQASRN